MPFRKVGPNRYKSPSGRTYTKKQVVAYYASGGTFGRARGHRKSRRKRGK